MPGLTIAIYDGVEPSSAALLHKTPEVPGQHLAADMSGNEYLVVGGHDWTLTMSAHDDFKALSPPDIAPTSAAVENILRQFPDASRNLGDYIDTSILDGLRK